MSLVTTRVMVYDSNMSKTVRNPNNRPRPRPAFVLLIAAVAGLVVWQVEGKSPLASSIAKIQPGTYLVSYVDDGDTIRVRDSLGHENTVRLIGVDTPEVKDPRKPVQCFGEEASNFTKRQLSGQRIRLVSDPLSADRDKYSRLLRYVYLGDGTFFNTKLVGDGYAFAYVVFPNSHLSEFVDLERQARDQNKGLWAGCGVNDSSKIKQTTGR